MGKSFVLTYAGGRWIVVNGMPADSERALREATEYAKSNPGSLVLVAPVMQGVRGQINVRHYSLEELSVEKF